MKDRNTDGQLHTQQHIKATKLAVQWQDGLCLQSIKPLSASTLTLHWDKQKML